MAGNYKRTVCIIASLALCVGIPLYAQNKKSQGAGSASSNTSILYLPEFYSPVVTHSGDTTFKYECYDKADKRINMDTLHDKNAIDEIWYVKSYYDKRYGGGVGISPPYFTAKIWVYSKVDKDSWLYVDERTNEKTMLKEYLGKVVRADSTVAVDPSTGGMQLKIRKYYRVEKE